MSINEYTPIEIYDGVYVKRDDLMGDNNELPPWGKLGGIKKLLEADIVDKSKGILQLSVRGSYSGWGIAALAPQLGYQVNIAYPNSKNFPQDVVNKWKEYDVNLVPLKPNMSSVVLIMANKYAAGNNLETLPYGFQHEVYFDYWEKRIQSQEGHFDTLVVCAGTPATCVGMIRGFKGDRINVVTTSSIEKTKKVLKSYGVYDDDIIRVYNTPFEFYDEMNFFETPFPCNVNWDKKAWWWIENNKDRCFGNVLFWNLGA